MFPNYLPMTFDRMTASYHVLGNSASQMQVILEESGGAAALVETSPKATVASLITSYCTVREVPFSKKWQILDDKGRPLPQFSTLASLGISDGQKLNISHTGSIFHGRERWFFLVALAALIICVGGILIISMIYGLTGGKYPDDYGVVMDAGSSKTNTLLYSWKGDKVKGTGHVTQVDNCFYEGGIAEMDPMRLDPVIDCAKQVTTRIEPEARNKTPLYFAATAGMRLLNLTYPTKVDDILEQLRLNLTKTGLSVKAIEVISGRDEGIYGWISANFLRQTLQIPQKQDPWVSTTYGALDMGGASAQISYAIPETNSTSEDISRLTLYGQTHHIFSYSNLCFGRTEAESRYRSLLVKDPDDKEVTDPCSPIGFSYNRTGTELFHTPCTDSQRFLPDPSTMGKNYTFRGSSDPVLCRQQVAKLLDYEKCQSDKFKECFRRAENTPKDQKFLAFATYYFTTSFLNATESNLAEYLEAVDAYCKLNVSEVEKITKKKFGKQYCFNGQYIYEALTAGFGFKNDTWDRIEFVGNIAGKDVGWSLGYMTNATNLIPMKAKSAKLMSATAFTVCLILFIVGVIGATVFILKNQKQ